MLQSGAAAGGLGTREAAAEAGHVVTAGTEAGDLKIRSAGVISLNVEIKLSREESFWLLCVVVMLWLWW